MSDLGLSPAAPQDPAPPDDRSASEIPLWVIVAVLVVMVAGAALVAVVLLVGKDAKATAPSYPNTWDPRIAPYVKIVEKQRGLTFLHPVTVRFLPDAQFEKTVRADESDLSADDRRDLERSAGMFRAFGLLSGKVDLFSAANEVSSSGTLAYYSFKDKRVTIKGDQLSPAVRPTLVHELTHALQDQHFAVGDRLQVLAKKNEKDSTGEYSVLDAIIEGDAERTEHNYLASLTAGQRATIAASSRAQESRAAASYAKVPQVIVTLFTAPYTLGEALVQAVAQDGGNTAVDNLIRDAPTHDASLLDPFRVLLADRDAKRPPDPAIPGSDKRFDHGEFGAVMWYLMLAQRLPLVDALTAVDGWGGDSYVAYEHDGVTCARAAYRGQEAADTARMLQALQQWIAAVPSTPASVQADGADLLFQSCDPGTGGTVGKQVSEKAVALAVARTSLGITVLRTGAPDQYARCIADKLIRAYTVAQLSDPQFGRNDPSVRGKVLSMAAACRT
ncbi:MAG TPA: hypothetical protein VHO29_01425 [Marmoricola sp.]|nr:hypothetical protein [Marmoricola sp.]